MIFLRKDSVRGQPWWLSQAGSRIKDSLVPGAVDLVSVTLLVPHHKPQP